MGPTARQFNGRRQWQLGWAASFTILAVGLWAASATATALTQPGAAGEVADIAATEDQLARMEDRYSDLGFDLGADGMTNGQGYLGAMFGPSVTRADLNTFVRVLELTAEQTEAAASVYSQRLENYQAVGGPMQKIIVEFIAKMLRQEAGGGDTETLDAEFVAVTAAARKVEAERRTMRAGVLEDLKSLLSPAQEARWPQLEQTSRQLQMSRSELLNNPGVHKDVVGLISRTIHELQVAKAAAGEATRSPATGIAAGGAAGTGNAKANGAVEQIVPACTEQIDALLKAHAAAVDAIALQILPLDDAMRSAQFADGRGDKEHEALKKAQTQGPLLVDRYRLRNDETVRKAGQIIAEFWGEGAKENLLSTYQREALPVLYRQRHGQRTLEVAQKLQDLSDQQRQAMSEMAIAHTAVLATLRPKAASQVMEQTQAMNDYRAATDDAGREKASERMGSQRNYDAEFQLYESDLKLLRQVRQLLTEDQRKRLPKRPVPKVMLDAGLGQEVAEEDAR